MTLEARMEKTAGDNVGRAEGLYNQLDMRQYSKMQTDTSVAGTMPARDRASEIQVAGTAQTPMGMLVLDPAGKPFGMLHTDGSYTARVGGSYLHTPSPIKLLPAPAK